MNAPRGSRRLAHAAAAALLLAGASAVTIGAALASSPHVHFGVVIGPRYWYHPYPPPYYYPYPPSPYYPPPYYPPLVVAPPAYVEKGQPAPPQAQAPQAPPAQVWYYCADENGYYPYVRQCPGGWQTVPAQPPPPAPAK